MILFAAFPWCVTVSGILFRQWNLALLRLWCCFEALQGRCGGVLMSKIASVYFIVGNLACIYCTSFRYDAMPPLVSLRACRRRRTRRCELLTELSCTVNPTGFWLNAVSGVGFIRSCSSNAKAMWAWHSFCHDGRLADTDAIRAQKQSGSLCCMSAWALMWLRLTDDNQSAVDLCEGLWTWKPGACLSGALRRWQHWFISCGSSGVGMCLELKCVLSNLSGKNSLSCVFTVHVFMEEISSTHFGLRRWWQCPGRVGLCHLVLLLRLTQKLCLRFPVIIRKVA